MYTAIFPFCGLGAGARGFLDAQVTMLGGEHRFRSLGGIDNDAAACRDFEYLTESPALCADIGAMTVEELRAFAGERAPDIVFASPPCKGFSGLLSKKAAGAARYRRLNRLVLDWVKLMLAAWPTPPRLFLLENVPRIESRGWRLLRAVRSLLRRAGYAFHGAAHDCGEIGGLAQHRTRYLLVARHQASVPGLLYQPLRKRVRACGEVLSRLPMPGTEAARELGPMHELPRLSWLNWVRLALIPAGGDWRDLPGVLVDGQPRRAVFRRHHVGRWEEPAATVAGSGSNGPSAAADPRWGGGPYGVLDWGKASMTVAGASRPSNGTYSVADPRVHDDAPPGIIPLADNPTRHRNKYRVVGWDEPAPAVIGATRPGSGGPSVADPRVRTGYPHAYGVLRWDESSPTVAGGSYPGQGAYSVADARVTCTPYAPTRGVLDWEEAARTVTGVDNGAFAVADPREPGAPPAAIVDDVRRPPYVLVDGRRVAVPVVIVAADGTWHRPLTTLELAALQGLPLVVRGRPLRLDGTSQSGWRERIGNAVPVGAATAIAEQALLTLVSADAGAWVLSAGGAVWVERAEVTG